MDPVLGGVITNGIGSLFSNIFGSSQNDKNNALQQKLFNQALSFQKDLYKQQVNDNYEQWKRQNAWDLSMWGLNNDYNSASSQVQRLRDAGINPALAFSSGQAGTASNIQSSQGQPGSVPSAPGVPHTQPFQPDMSGVLSASDILANMQLKQSEVDRNNSQGGLYGSQMNLNTQAYGQNNELFPYQLDYNKWLAREKKYDSYLRETEVDFANKTFMDRAKQYSLDNSLKVSQRALLGLQADAQQELNKYIPAKEQASIFQSTSEALYKLALKWQIEKLTPTQIGLNLSQIKKNIWDAAKSCAESYGHYLNNQILEQVSDSIITSTINAAELSNIEVHMANMHAETLFYDTSERRNRYQHRYVEDPEWGRDLDIADDFFSMLGKVFGGTVSYGNFNSSSRSSSVARNFTTILK